MITIIGKYKDTIRVLDTAETMIEAYKLLSEYKEAYGPKWEIDIKVS